jgi:hypothetical protein
VSIGKIKLAWNPPLNCWVADLLDATDSAILQGVPLVTGANLLEQFSYLGLGGQLLVQTEGDVDAVPTFENLGSEGRLYFATP